MKMAEEHGICAFTLLLTVAEDISARVHGMMHLWLPLQNTAQSPENIRLCF